MIESKDFNTKRMSLTIDSDERDMENYWNSNKMCFVHDITEEELNQLKEH